ncbi:MAG: magnesium transporter CorA family protein [Spirochaetia bacterium]
MIFEDRKICSPDQIFSWVRVINPSEEELTFLSENYAIDPALILEVLDPDELSRHEVLPHASGRLIIMRLPYSHPKEDFSHATITYSCFLLPQAVITVCRQHIPMFEREFFRRIEIAVPNISCFILNILLYAGLEYLQHLKELKMTIDELEFLMDGAVRSQEAIKLLRIEKSLHYFQTSLHSNQMLLEKIEKVPNWANGKEERELIDDVDIELREAVEITQIYLKILRSMTDAFSSLINNNLNLAMKRLTVISLVLMLPTVVASFFGMNVELPMPSDGKIYFWAIAFFSILISAAMLLVFKIRRFF